MRLDATPKQKKVIAQLIAGADITDAAASVGVARSTVWRWSKQDRFKRALADAEADALAVVSRALVRMAHKAVETLERTMDDPNASPASKVRAADIILGRLLQLRQLVDFESRLLALEKEHGRSG